jgi:hypothetical protein
VWAHVWQIDTKLWPVQHHDELAGERATIDAQMTELHRCKAALGTECATAIDYTKARAQSRVIATTINHKGTPHPTFPRASQNVAAAVTLLDTLPAPSTDEVSMVYQ